MLKMGIFERSLVQKENIVDGKKGMAIYLFIEVNKPAFFVY